MQLCLPLVSQNRSDLIPKCCLCCIFSCYSPELTLPLPPPKFWESPKSREHWQRSLPTTARSRTRVTGCSCKTGLCSSNPSVGETGTKRVEGELTDGSSRLHGTARFKSPRYKRYTTAESLHNLSFSVWHYSLPSWHIGRTLSTSTIDAVQKQTAFHGQRMPRR